MYHFSLKKCLILTETEKWLFMRFHAVNTEGCFSRRKISLNFWIKFCVYLSIKAIKNALDHLNNKIIIKKGEHHRSTSKNTLTEFTITERAFKGMIIYFVCLCVFLSGILSKLCKLLGISVCALIWIQCQQFNIIFCFNHSEY